MYNDLNKDWLKKQIIIKTNSGQAEFDTMEKIHKQLAGNKDYLNSNIMINDSGMRNRVNHETKGYIPTMNEVHIYIFDACTEVPSIVI